MNNCSVHVDVAATATVAAIRIYVYVCMYMFMLLLFIIYFQCLFFPASQFTEHSFAYGSIVACKHTHSHFYVIARNENWLLMCLSTKFDVWVYVCVCVCMSAKSDKMVLKKKSNMVTKIHRLF